MTMKTNILPDIEKTIARTEATIMKYVKKHPIYSAIIAAGLIAAAETIQSALDE
ncbi:hypothetical protein KW805_03755 [Candidatus Pacearchaeota archaeon]|nr:hypothetical protein [Candidatus Pacearchaeota archaeon]